MAGRRWTRLNELKMKRYDSRLESLAPRFPCIFLFPFHPLRTYAMQVTNTFKYVTAGRWINPISRGLERFNKMCMTLNEMEGSVEDLPARVRRYTRRSNGEYINDSIAGSGAFRWLSKSEEDRADQRFNRMYIITARRMRRASFRIQMWYFLWFHNFFCYDRYRKCIRISRFLCQYIVGFRYK